MHVIIYRKCLNETLYKNELKYSRSRCLFISPLKNDHNCRIKDVWILSRRRSLPYKNKSIDLQDWFLYVRDLRHERIREDWQDGRPPQLYVRAGIHFVSKLQSTALIEERRLKRLCQSRKSCSCEMTKLSYCFFPNRWKQLSLFHCLYVCSMCIWI